MISQGLKIGDYVIEDEIGSGGFGRVYLAKDENTGQLVAIKFLHPRNLHAKEAKDAFIGEMINQARLSTNPNIVHVIRNIRCEDRQGESLGLVMEFVDGDPLDLFIQRYSLLPEYIAIPIFLQVLNGLAFAHHHKMIHRDIKPGNIMIGKDGVVKIMDFGLSKIITSSTSASESARAASLNYVSPERLEKKSIDQRTDIYSLGISFYETLTGVPPYKIEYGDWQTAIAKHKSGKFKSIQQFYPGHSESLDAMIRKMLSPTPSARYSHCDEIITELKSIWSESKIPETVREEFLIIIEKTDKITVEKPGQLASQSSIQPEKPLQITAQGEIDLAGRMLEERTEPGEGIKINREARRKWVFWFVGIPVLLLVIFFILKNGEPRNPRKQVLTESRENVSTNDSSLREPRAGSTISQDMKGVSSGNFYTIQVGSFGILSNAENYSKKFREMGYETKVYPVIVNQKDFFRVYVGRFANAEEAEEEKKKLERIENAKFVITKLEDS